MFLFVAITLGLQLTTFASGGLLDDCPFDKGQRIENELVVDVLVQFSKDLLIVQAITGARLDRDYDRLIQEMHISGGSGSQAWISEDVHKYFYWIVYLLRQNKINFARSELSTLRSYGYVSDGKEMTYLHYLDAEADRLLNNNSDASASILSAYTERHGTPGITMNELERLDGLISIQKVSHFNQDVDWYHGVRRSPDYQLLSKVHETLGFEMAPLDSVRSIALAHFSDSSKAAPSRAMERTLPELDNISGHSVSYESAKAILCEFARKLALLGISSRDRVPVDYGTVIEQVRRVDQDFAAKLSSKVLPYLERDFKKTRKNLLGIWASELKQRNYDKTLVQFTRYFTAELYHLRIMDRCNLRYLDDMNDEMVAIKNIRQKNRGVSLDKLYELEGKFVVAWLKCFHERVKLAYNLVGNESERQLVAKRASIGADREWVLPDSTIF